MYLLFIAPLKAAEKKTILRDEYDIDLTGDMEDEMNTMCNFGEGIAERAMAEGEAIGMEKERLAALKRIIKETPNKRPNVKIHVSTKICG